MSATNDHNAQQIGWAVLELMGHRKLAGKVQEATLAGGAFLRIDVCVVDDGAKKEGELGFVLDDDGAPLKVLATQFYSPSSVYCMTPTTRDVCLRLSQAYQPEPVTRWELPAPEPSRQPLPVGDDGLPY